MSTRDFNKKSEITGVIDLSRLPPPVFVEEQSFETLQTHLRDKFVEFAQARGVQDYSLDPADPMAWAIELLTYESLRVRKRTNNQSLLSLPSHSTGSWLDNVMASFGAPARIEYDDIDPATGKKRKESDEAYLRRALLAPDQFSTTGCDAAYVYNCLLVASRPENQIPALRFVKPSNAGKGVIVVALLFDYGEMKRLQSGSTEGQKDSARILALFEEHLNSPSVRNINEEVKVQLAAVREVPLGVTNIHVPPGVSPEVIRLEAVAQLRDYQSRAFEIGGIISVSGIHTACTAPAVIRVEATQFSKDVEASAIEAPYLTFNEGDDPQTRDIRIVQVSR